MGYELSIKNRELLQSFTQESMEKDNEGQKPEQEAPVSKSHERSRDMMKLTDQLRTAMQHEDKARIAELQEQIAAYKEAEDKQAWAEGETAGSGGKFQMGEVERTTAAQGSKQAAYNNMPDRE